MESTSDSSQINQLVAGVKRRDRACLAEALNLVDDRRPLAHAQAAKLLQELEQASLTAHSHLIGLTGPPGAGKSTLTAALISLWRQRGKRVGVLAVDPSSPISGGALLGDRLRMKISSGDDGVFIRSLASRGEFGGLSAEVWPMSLVMLAAFDVVLIETVGVGQREVDVAGICDTTCYVAQPGSGDSIQFLKAGIMEVPHLLVVNKEDMGAVARRTLAELGTALGKGHADGNWEVPVLAASATVGSGIEGVADALHRHWQTLLNTGQLSSRRKQSQAGWIIKRLRDEFGSHGISRLGGEDILIQRIRDQRHSLFEQHEILRLILLETGETHA